MNKIYAEKVELLLKIIPIISQDTEFAIHGGTAINLFVKNLPRYSVDIDLTYIPMKKVILIGLNQITSIFKNIHLCNGN